MAERHVKRIPAAKYIRNEDKLIEIIGIDAGILLGAMAACYQTLDAIDEQLISKGTAPVANLVEPANLSSMVENLIAAGIADSSNGLYARNRPHAYPDLLPLKRPAVDLELKIALETNRPKGHLPKPGAYMTFRYPICIGRSAGALQTGKGAQARYSVALGS